MAAPLNAVTLRLTLDGSMGRTSFETAALAPAEVAARYRRMLVMA